MVLSKIIENRYSCRDYTSEAVSDEQLEYIKECVRLAPSAVNKQPWRFRIIKSEEGKRKLRECYDREWFATAPMYIIASVLHDQEWVRKDGKSHGNIDISIAVGRASRNHTSRTSSKRYLTKETQGYRRGIYRRVTIVCAHICLICINKIPRNLSFFKNCLRTQINCINFALGNQRQAPALMNLGLRRSFIKRRSNVRGVSHVALGNQK